MKTKKSQITIFLILIIVIIILVSAFMFYRNSIREKRTDDEVSRTGKIPSDLEPVINYVQSCVEKLAKEGIFLLGEQGGYLYKDQGGTKIDFPDNTEGTLFLEYRDKKVPYKIQLPVAGIECDPILPGHPTKSHIPYPYGKEFLFDNPDPLIRQSYLLDKKYEQKDCFGKRIKLNLEESMEDLRSYMIAKIPITCDLSSLEVFDNYDFDTTDPEVALETGASKTDFKVLYPNTATSKDKGTIINFETLRVTLKLSLKDLFEFINARMQYDISNPTYNISRSDETEDFEVLILPSIRQKDSIITIVSDKLMLDRKPFKFLFGRKNRYPVLEYVHDVAFDDVPFIDGQEVKWDDVILQDLMAVDPDEETASIKVLVGEGIYQKEFTEDQPYLIRPGDITQGHINFRIFSSDGEYEDYQEFQIS